MEYDLSKNGDAPRDIQPELKPPKKKNLRRFRGLQTKTGMEDGGVVTFTFQVDTIFAGKIYTEADRSLYDEHGRNSKPFFVDDNGCARDIETMLLTGVVEEIF